MSVEIRLPEPCAKLISKLNQAGYEAYIVGGCVRDSLLGIEPEDWDICTDALPEEMLEVFTDHKVIPTGLKHGTLTVFQSGVPMEVTTYRIDGVYEDHRRPSEVHFTSRIEEDLSRRDFTINAMAWHPVEGLVDPFNGLEDLAAHVVRAVGDAWERFEEDGLRIMRLVRFATRLGFDYNPHTYRAARNKAHLLRYVSPERRRVELDKILVADQVARGLMDLSDLGLFPYLLPEKCHEVLFRQDTGGHFLDVFEHSALATGLIPPVLTLRLTMMLHDIGKPFTLQQRPDGSDHFPDHEEVGAKIANSFLRDLRYDNQTRRQVVTLIRHHNDTILADAVNLRGLLRTLGEKAVWDLIEVKVADILAHDISYKMRQETLAYFGLVKAELKNVLAAPPAWAVKHLAIDGQTLLAHGYKGREIGQTLERLLDEVIADPSCNTENALLHFLKAHPPGWSTAN